MRRVLTFLVSLALTATCGFYGVSGVVDRVRGAGPRHVGCDAREFGGDRWLRVGSCQFKPSAVMRGSGGAWLMLEHVNGANAAPLLFHTTDKARLEMLDGLPVDDPRRSEVLGPFFAGLVDPIDVPGEVREAFPGDHVALEEAREVDTEPGLIWPVVSIVVALFWALVAFTSLMPRKKEPAPYDAPPRG